MAAPIRRPLFPVLAMLLLALTGAVACADTTAPDIESTRFASSLGVDLAASTRTESGLYYRDIVVGSGAAAARGDTATGSYALYNVNGSQWEAGPFSFELGDPLRGAIRGFDEGLTGMKVGGRRQLIVPPHLGYGNQWAGNIPPNSILVFNVELTGLK